jgi:hypothetical protein
MHVIIADLDEGLRHDIRIERTRRRVRILIGDARKILKGLGRVLLNPRPGFIHRPELPQRDGLAGIGRPLEGGHQIVAAQLGRRHAIQHLGQFLGGIERALRLRRQHSAEGQKSRTCRSQSERCTPDYRHYTPSHAPVAQLSRHTVRARCRTGKLHRIVANGRLCVRRRPVDFYCFSIQFPPGPAGPNGFECPTRQWRFICLIEDTIPAHCVGIRAIVCRQDGNIAACHKVDQFAAMGRASCHLCPAPCPLAGERSSHRASVGRHNGSVRHTAHQKPYPPAANLSPAGLG